MRKLILLRHGQSMWNLENRFTGWTDVDLSAYGLTEAHNAGKLLGDQGCYIDIAFTSVLKRAIRTLWVILDELDLMWIPVQRSWRLNERHYGALQGLNKQKTQEIHGEVQVNLWRRSFDTSPPPLSKDDKRHPRFDPRYVNLNESEIPCCESLKDTFQRLIPYWQGMIQPQLKENKTVLICAHGNSLRSLVKLLDDPSDKKIAEIEIPNGRPLIYELDTRLKPVRHYYLGIARENEKS